MEDKLILLKTYNSPIDANIDKGLLGANGIEAVLFDENTVYANPILTTTVGGVKLLVRESDYQESLDVLNDLGNEIQEADSRVLCPNCNSDDVKSKLIRHWIAILIMIFSFSVTPSTSNLKKYKCNNCGKKWSDLSDST